MKKSNIYWLFQLSGWLFFGIAQIFLYSSTGQPIDKMHLVGQGLQVIINILLTHGFRLVIIRFRWLDIRIIKLIPLVFLFVFAMSAAASCFLVVIIMPDIPIEAIVAHMLESIFVFLLWSLAYFIYLYFERYNRSLKYQATVRETELNNLKSQLNPHFIFNALNSIRALVDENPEKSKEAITQLSHILRNSLNSDRQKLVPFAEELRTVKDYLGLESIRYEERLKTKIELAEGSLAFQIPPLMLQTLVENGIKHGVAKLTKGGEISLTTKVREDLLIVEIRNSGQLNEKKKWKDGFGIQNTQKRLEMIYGGRASFKVMNENDKTVLTQIKLPK